MRRLPPTSALQAFVTVAQHRTLKAASGELNLSVSALSRRIQALETYVGKPMFERLHHELRLTPDGEQLFVRAGPPLESLVHILDELRGNSMHELSVGIAPSFASAWLLPRLGGFKRLYPDILLDFDSSGKPLTKLGNSLDAAIVFAETIDGDLYSNELKPQSAFLVCAPGFIEDNCDIATAIRENPLLLHRGLPKVLPLWLDAVGLSGLTPHRIEYYDSGPMLLAAAESGLGLALTLGDTIRFFPSGGKLIRPFGEAVASPYSYYFVAKQAAMNRQAVRRFHDWLFAEAANEPLP